MFKKSVLLAVLAALLLAMTVTAQAQEIKIGVLAKRGAATCMQKWGATASYLSDQLGTPVKIVPLKFEAIEPACAAGRVDFILANSAFYVQLEQKHGAKAVCTLINSRKGQALDRFGGVLFVKADSPIKSVEDVRNQRFMCVKQTSFGGAHMAWRMLLDHGIDPKVDCSEFKEGGKHDNVVLAVLNGATDVGTVRSDTIERMVDEGKIALSDFRILNQFDDDFPFVHSTQLYPEWPVAVLPHVDADVAASVAGALQRMTPDSPAAQAAKCVGWTEPADYSPVTQCLEAIGLGS